MLGVPQERIINANREVFIQAKELIVASFINNWEIVTLREYKHYQKQWLPSWISNLYREKIIPNIKISCKKRIYISRSQSKTRKIENEYEVCAVFTALGFGVYNLELMSVKEQIELFSNASIIAGIHGAGLINMVFSPIQTRIFEIYTEYYHDASHRIQAKVLGFKYYYMIGETKNVESIVSQQENVFVNIEKLKLALQYILTEDKKNA